MEILASIPFIGGLLSTVIPFLIVLGIVVTIHEYGHYIVGRWCGIHAEVFSIGYGRPVWSRVDKRGTVWQVAWLPLGGFVKFLGDANAASFGDSDDAANVAAEDRSRAFPTASVGRRAATVAAGPFFNFILSAIIFTGIALYVGQATKIPTVGEMRIPIQAPYDLRADDQLLAVNGNAVETFSDIYDALDEMEPKGDLTVLVNRAGDEMEVRAPYLLPPLVSRVTPLSPASRAGLMEGDLIVSLGGENLSSFDDLKRVVLASEGQSLDITVLRDGATETMQITPKITDIPNGEGAFEKRVMIGVSGSLAFDVKTERPEFFPTLWRGTKQVYEVIKASLNGLMHIVRGAFGAEDGLGAENLQGPIGIAQISGESASQGFMNFIELIALLSTAIGMLNLFPIPILDGGHLVMFAYEAVTGKPPHDRVLDFAMRIGLVLLVALTIFATYNDIMRI